MTEDIRLPSVTGLTPDEKIGDILRYIYQQVEQLNFNFRAIDKEIHGDGGTTETTGTGQVSIQDDGIVSPYIAVEKLLLGGSMVKDAVKVSHVDSGAVDTGEKWAYQIYESGLFIAVGRKQAMPIHDINSGQQTFAGQWLYETNYFTLPSAINYSGAFFTRGHISHNRIVPTAVYRNGSTQEFSIRMLVDTTSGGIPTEVPAMILFIGKTS